MNRVHDDQGTTETEGSNEEYTVCNIGRYSNDPVYVHMLISGKRVSRELDTGAEVSIISKKLGKRYSQERNYDPRI